MSSDADTRGCGQRDQLSAYALQTLAPRELGEMRAHLSRCADCRQQLEALAPVVAAFVAWPTDLLRPPPSLWDRVSQRIGVESGPQPAPARWEEPEWEEVAPGISCKVLATDALRDRVSMLVRLAPGVDYPAHVHAGVEELHLLDGELWIDDRKLYPGDFNRAEAGTSDLRVWSETGCTCVLVTSLGDVLR